MALARMSGSLSLGRVLLSRGGMMAPGVLAASRHVPAVREFSTSSVQLKAATTGVKSSKKSSKETDTFFGRGGGGTVQTILELKGRNFYKCRKDDTVFHAIEEMVRHNIGSLVVVEPHNKKIGSWKPIGIITERDYMEKGIVVGRASKETLVKDVMSSKGLISVQPSANLYRCMELMTDNHIRHIPVVSEDKVLLGMISIGDVVKELVKSQKKEMAEMASFVAGDMY
mmetsp:Transcript_12767/g.39198  ORF Transcript_12767/g.39198 Transcript_12767/m.39198 type:complete len:227 (+) Transcript_12767:199-879(+)|eukprot:CAMPEP_0198736940 /NCGR_PEP_ID=MMETSP1475-20131203/67608_1 /TAXON_ID= ORGANISM="Unidentified sp., Strain CCMP1999" /NCGR_SAMPLE_ID=MMETSP1475 /ASSEMBLY_ACC=CAM_ASM_001111 /LENGTH=226 /DNA_ID=CAMNT_0044500793 /DNA_START=139 /DNA_END=819 /DNA_ORIENTATION=+